MAATDSSTFREAVINPIVAALERVGGGVSLTVELETVGRKSGLPRRVKLTGRADDTGVWVISQHGWGSAWAKNIWANPSVRVCAGAQWRLGTAHFRPNDDVRARARGFVKGRIAGAALALGMWAMEHDPISVRIDYTD
jgi:deazaflavin-dependent oxidoreductase (nitroreductase family)